MSTLAYRPLPAVSIAAALMAVGFGGCGCAQAPSSSTETSRAAIVQVASETSAPTTPLPDARDSRQP